MVKIIFQGNVLHNSDSNEVPKFIMGGREAGRVYIGSNELTQKETDSNLPVYARPEEMLRYDPTKNTNESSDSEKEV